MSDQRLREAEKRATATGSPEDRAALLRVRLRTAPGCERCGGLGRATQVGNGWKYEPGRYPNLDPSAGVAHIVPCPSCSGTGSPLRARVELAAYLRDEVARAVVTCAHRDLAWGPGGCGCYEAGSPRLDQWLSGLSHWQDIGPAPGWVLVKAAVAAARVALVEWLAGQGWWLAGREAGDTDGGGLCHTSGREQPEQRWRAVQAPLLAIEAAEAWLECPCFACERRWEEVFTAARRVPSAVLWLPAPPSMANADMRANGLKAASWLAGEHSVRSAIRDSLVSWALSTGEGGQ